MDATLIKKRIVRIIFGTIGLMIVAILFTSLYYFNEIRLARRDTKVLFESALKKYGTELKLSDLSSIQKKMLISVEDPQFLCHHGVDHETPGAGMTTLTQGLVKLIYFPEGFQQGIAKVRQTLIAQYALDEIVSKEDQLLLFLNICYLGNKGGQEIHGYSNAAKAYFSKDFSKLSDDEFLSLVAMHIRPNDLKPDSEANIERVTRIKSYLSGEYKPVSVLDVDYNGKQNGTLSEELFMAFLRLIVNANPDRKISH